MWKRAIVQGRDAGSQPDLRWAGQRWTRGNPRIGAGSWAPGWCVWAAAGAASCSRETGGRGRVQDGKSRIPPWTCRHQGRRGHIEEARDLKSRVGGGEVWARMALKGTRLVGITRRGEKGAWMGPRDTQALEGWKRSPEEGKSLDKKQSGARAPQSRRAWRRQAPLWIHRPLRPYLGDLHAISDTTDAHFVDLIRVGVEDDLGRRQDGVRLEQRDVSQD